MYCPIEPWVGSCYDGLSMDKNVARLTESVVRAGPNYTRWLYALVVLLTVIAGLYLSGWIYGALTAAGDILTLYFTAWLLQFFITPIVDVLARRGVPRLLGVSFVYLLLTLVIALAFVNIVPATYARGVNAVAQLSNPKTYNFISETTTGIEKFLLQHGVPQKDIKKFTEDYSANLSKGALKAGPQLQNIIRSHLDPRTLANSTNSFVDFLSTIQSLLINVVLVLILAFYMTLDGHKLVRRALSYFPPSVSEVMESVHVIINRKFGGYLRGQLILAVSYGVLTYIIALGFGLRDSAVLVAVLAGATMLIPYIGAFAAVGIPMAAYVLAHVTDTSFPVGPLLLLLVFLFAAQHLVLNLLAPRIMGSAVGMHPILVILGLLLGTRIAGLWGAIFGVPVFGVLLDTADLVYRRVMDRRYGFHPPAVADIDKSDDTDPPRRPPSAVGGQPRDEAARDATKEPAALHRAGATRQGPLEPLT